MENVFFKLSNADIQLIGTIESFCKTKAFYGEEKVIPLMIELDDGIRLRRALDREMAQDQPKYDEMCRRYLADAADFSPEKKKEAGIEKEFLNDELYYMMSGAKAPNLMPTNCSVRSA